MRSETIGIVCAAMMFAFGAPALAQTGDVLAPARQGQQQCYAPDTLRRVCSALASYTFHADGAIENGAQVLVSDDPVIVMSGVSTVSVRNGAVCGPLTTEDLARSTFTVNGQLASPDDSAFLREQLAQAPDFLADEVCTSFTPAEDGLRSHVTVDGEPRPDGTVRVIWVRPDQGYRVAP